MRTTSLFLRACAAGSSVACVAAVVLMGGPVAAAAMTPSIAARHAPMDPGARADSLGIQRVPKGSAASARRSASTANPYLSDGVDPATVDWASWQATMAAAGKVREANRTEPNLPIEMTEAEAGAASNNTPATAELIPALGTGGQDNPAARLTGELAVPQAAPVGIPTAPEDNGSITLAGDLDLSSTVTTTVSSVLGDGPHGIGSNDEIADGTGDFDFYRVDGSEGGFVSVDLDTPLGGSLDSVLVLWTADGQAIMSNDDSGGSTDSLLVFQLPTDGPFYISVAGFGDPVPYDPFDSSTGFGGGSTGDYTLTATQGADVDNYAVDLDPGDVLGISVSGAAGRLEVHDPAEGLVIRSAQDLSGIYPPSSPLPGGGNAVAGLCRGQWWAVHLPDPRWGGCVSGDGRDLPGRRWHHPGHPEGLCRFRQPLREHRHFRQFPRGSDDVADEQFPAEVGAATQ